MSVSAATLVHGDTGSGKTTLLATLARWVWETFKVPSRLYTFDPGGFSDDVLALINLGIIEVWRAYTRDPDGYIGLPSETLLRACQGYWPAEINPETGESPLGVKLLAPPADWRGALMFDGLTGMCDWSMDDMGVRAAQGTLGGEGSNMKTVQSGDMKMGIGNRASVGFTQNKVRQWILSSLSVKGQVVPPTFTALELKTTDSDTKLPLYGPKIAGQAKTSEVPAWFGASLGTCLATDAKGRPQWRLYLQDYIWPPSDLTPHKCKIRTAASVRAELPEYLADDATKEPPDKPLTYFNLGFYHQLFADIRERVLKQAAEQFKDAPGLKKSTVGKPVEGPKRAAPAPAAPKGLKRSSAPPPGPAVQKKKTPPAPAAPPEPKPQEEKPEKIEKEVGPDSASAKPASKRPAPTGPRPVPKAGPRRVPRSPVPARAAGK
jgi:hypothetical protein